MVPDSCHWKQFWRKFSSVFPTRRPTHGTIVTAKHQPNAPSKRTRCDNTMYESGQAMEIDQDGGEYRPKNTSLPDLDDQSMTYVFAYVEHYHNDLFWSFLSDFCFLLGSILYLCLAYYDFVDAEPSLYYLLEFIAPISYLANSAIDVHWALEVQRRQQVKKVMKHTFDQTIEKQRSEEETILKWWQRVRKHAAHRRGIYAAATFGIAAFFGVVSVLLDYYEQEENETNFYSVLFDGVSDHMYVVSAIIAITGRRTRPWFASDHHCCGIFREPEAFENIGDFLFLVGSLWDAILDDIQMDGVPICGVVSSVLWFVDALFYLRSDFVMAHRVNKRLAFDNDDPSAVFV